MFFVVIVFLIIFLYKEYLRPTITFLIAIVALIIGGVITPEEALSGFANVDLAVIILLLIISTALGKTSMLSQLFRVLMKPKDSVRSFQLKMMTSVGISSAFLNNTPLVAMFMPFVHSWAKEKKLSPSRFLIPLSFASILGGCITLIGTSTNLIVNGLAIEAGAESLQIFDFAYAGVPMLVLGIGYLMIVSKKMLPDNQTPVDELIESERKFFLETHIKKGSRLIGKSVEDGGLRNLKDLFLIEIGREKRVIMPVSPKEILREGDVLFFGGNLDSIAELTSPALGLSLPKSCDIPRQEKNKIVEIVISHNSNLIGKKVQNTDFRGRYDGAILAIHRNGEKLWGKIGEIELNPGDVLLVLSGKDFFIRVKNTPAFYILSQEKEIYNVDWKKVTVLVAGLITSIFLVFFGVHLFISLSVVLTLILLLKIIKPIEIRNGLDYDLILIIALGLALGKAMDKSHAAELVAESIDQLSGPFGVIGLLSGLFLVTNLLSAFMTSKAAVAITLPIALSIAMKTQLPQEPFILIIAYGGAANFITPIGYQTNLMVYGPGGYSFKDFFKIGLPLMFIYLITSVVVLGYIYELF